MVKVIKWPDLPVLGWEFTRVHPVSRSQSALTGADYLSQSKVSRRVGALTINGVSTSFDAGGTIEMLKDEIAGVNLVRIVSIPAHWHLAHLPVRGRVKLNWTAGGIPLNWTADGVALNWYSGAALYGVPFDDGDYQGLEISGLTPGAVAVYPNETLSVGETRARSYHKAVAGSDGKVRIRVNRPIAEAGAVKIGVDDERVYRLDDQPRAMRTLGSQFRYDFAFREVFEDETDGFEEVDPLGPIL